MTVSAFPLVQGTWGIKRCQAHRARGAGEGVSPFFRAFLLATLRRSLPVASGTREARSRDTPGSFAPPTRVFSTRGPWTVCTTLARSIGVKRPATVSERVV